jgi:hypothetical protein
MLFAPMRLNRLLFTADDETILTLSAWPMSNAFTRYDSNLHCLGRTTGVDSSRTETLMAVIDEQRQFLFRTAGKREIVQLNLKVRRTKNRIRNEVFISFLWALVL